MSSKHVYSFSKLRTSDLLVDALYEGGTQGNAGDDPLNKLIGGGSQGGFRYINGNDGKPKFVILYSSLDDPDWPDSLDARIGTFIYYGDNKRPGNRLEETPRGGNKLLAAYFDILHTAPDRRREIAPFFVFTKGYKGRDVIFRGLAVPGAAGASQSDDLVAVWKSISSERFQNYKALFTVLDVPEIKRAWLDDILAGQTLTANSPAAWRRWVTSGSYTPLIAPRSVAHRHKAEQLPQNQLETDIVKSIYEYFKEDPFKFERCAVELSRLMDHNICEVDLTRRWMDGGRDATGKYRIGTKDNGIYVDFALEAKCFKPSNGVGVKSTSRLISRLRFRQFGIFVTTSHLDQQAYKEIIEDGHPVIVIAARDIATILINAGYGSVAAVKSWLKSEFPR